MNVRIKSKETTNILGSEEPVWEFTATPTKVFTSFKGDSPEGNYSDGWSYKLTLRQTTGINHPDKIFSDLLAECPSTLGALYSYVGPQVKSAYVEPVKVSYIWEDADLTLHKFVKFLDPNLTTSCVLIGIAATWMDIKAAKKRKK